MGIEGMLEREDFYKILQETLVEYFAKVRRKDVRCSCEPFEGGEELRVFTVGSLVCRSRKPIGARTFLSAELNVRSSAWKYVVGKVLVHYMMMTHTAFSPGKVFLTKDTLGKNEIISPQNRSIRVYDYDKTLVDCIIKRGFTDRYFNNQIDFRKNYDYDFMVPLIDSGEGWFREPILKGHPLARVTGKNRYQKGLDEAIKNIQILSEDTLEFIPCQEYISPLLNKAKQMTQQAKQNKEISSYDLCVALIDFVENGLNGVSMQIPTCISHGDFQTGNIWVDSDGKVLIYDWETAGRRSVWYDCTTLLYSLRRVFGWDQFLNNNNPVLSLTCDPIKNRNKAEHGVIKKIVLLEDYLFLLEDMMELPSDWGRRIFDRNIAQLHQTITNNSIA